MAITHVFGSIRPIKDHILVQDMDFGERKTRTGIIILGDNGEDRGIRPRWAKVYSVGPLQNDIQPNQYVLISHARWTRGVDVTDENGNTVTVRRVDNQDVLLVSDEYPGIDETIGDK